MESAQAKKLGYVPGLDGLRGLAITIVVVGHLTHWSAGGGGVDLFFVLSGFLITTLLLEEHEARGRVSLGAFYVRRARRLLPALGVLLTVYVIVTVARGQSPPGWQMLGFAFYGGNLFAAFVMSSAQVGSFGVVHLWSLAEEEQFYLLWPLLLLVLVGWRRRPSLLVVARILAITLLLLLVWRVWLLFHGTGWQPIYFAPWLHADGLLVGCVLGLVRFSRPDRLIVPDVSIEMLAVTVIAFCLLFATSGFNAYELQMPIFCLACACLVVAAVARTPLTRPLSHPTLVWVGKISYSLYLWHYLIMTEFNDHDRLFIIALSVAAATASYYLVEQRFRRPRPTVVDSRSRDARQSTAAAANAMRAY